MAKLKLMLACILASSLTACGGWTTRYSGKYDEENRIVINLDKDGAPFLGSCGFGNELLDSYKFDLKPIRRAYTDGEIKLIRDMNFTFEEIKPVKGTISFDESYSTVTIDIQVLKDGRYVPFSGNGTYRINEND
jgi:uncharacterized lipoprotein YehR (DUF1307 family)